MSPERQHSVTVVDVSPRDGLQIEPYLMPTPEKVELVRRLTLAGLRRIEVTSFVNPARVPQMADAESLLDALRDLQGVSLSALVLNERGFERALGSGLHEVTYVVPATDAMAQRNQGADAATVLAGWRAVASRAGEAGFHRSVTIAVAFGCPFEGRVPHDRVVELAMRIRDCGADELSLADTIGVAAPAEVEDLFAALAGAVPEMALRAHLHNTRNTGYANAWAALRAGVRTLDASLGGLGGCPFAPGATGNIATEDLVYMLERMGMGTGINAGRLGEGVYWLEERLGRRLPGHCAHVGPAAPAKRGAAA